MLRARIDSYYRHLPSLANQTGSVGFRFPMDTVASRSVGGCVAIRIGLQVCRRSSHLFSNRVSCLYDLAGFEFVQSSRNFFESSESTG